MQPLRDHDPDRIADYRLIGRLGEGGMGVVYLARSSRGRTVAVKTIRAELAASPEFRRRSARETAAARRVGGDRAAPVLAADPDAPLPWVATAYVAGPTLHEVVAARYGPLPEYSVRALAAGLCRALDDIHAAGLVHRDLKPSNVLITIDGPTVIDFGIARALDDSLTGGLTTTGAVIGSPGFMSPEQVRGETLTVASDVFALGAVLAFAACGRLPFGAPDGAPHALMYRVVHESPDLAGVPEPLRGLVGHCLAKDPADRPALAELRDREELRGGTTGPWLPPELLAGLGRDAVRLLQHEDPRGPAPHVSTEARAIAAAPTAPATAPSAAPAPDRRDGRPAGERARTRGRAAEVSVILLLALFAAVSLVTAVHQISVAIGMGEMYSRYDDYTADKQAWVDVFSVLMPAQIAVGAALVVCWLIWFARLRAVAGAIAPGRLRHRPSLAVAGWLVPGVNLFVPKRIADDIWRASTPSGRRPAGARPPRAWWIAWLATFLTWPGFWFPWTLGLREDWVGLDPAAGSGEHLGLQYSFTPSAWIALVLHLTAVPAAIVTASHVHRLSAAQAAPRGH
ncbi:protein kinase [Streptomyces sp. RFCAC02]|uniref:protein kinase domain-containing protein n=1 Tax=Streptomyces sp. RFCAC02 TaxID=2499143 RepID=UPI001022634D|nr:protein kinase [Streptomyces sp. RFCAC02]